MASAFQSLPPPSPGVVYPTTVTTQPSSHSNGSFAMVFVVLAIILVVSAVACVLGRLCNKRAQRGPNQTRPNNKRAQHDKRFGPDERHGFPPNGRPKERDVEFGFGPNEPGFGPNEPGFGPNEPGFDKKVTKIKIVPREDGRGGPMMMPPPNSRNGEFGGHSMGNQMPPRNGEFGERSMGSQMPRMMESPRNFR